ncbi:O-antigen ligase family protein [Micromonospora sp. DT81.3]|uniref:O-antigen ligase family protein n=1 Tax=Micromonospora sp. DT81.3 TaxID=3416523 RepID=UPI003CEB8FC1
MAEHTKHPVAAPPTAPARETTGHLLLRGYCILVLFTLLAATAWYNLLGPIGTTILALTLGAVTIAIWVPRIVRQRTTNPLPWRRLPWFLLVYVAWALISVTWSAWPAATLTTWLSLAITTLQGLFMASVLTWREIVRALASALKWVLGLSLVFELWVSLVVRAKLLPNFLAVPEGELDPQWYWSRNNLFVDGGRLQGIAGNANLLAITALLGIIVFAIRIASRAARRSWLIAWIVLAGFLTFRAESATAYVCAVAVLVVLATILLMRRTTRPGERTRYYIAYAVVGFGGLLSLWVFRERFFGLVGRDSDLTGRERIWSIVLEKAWQHPVHGWGFATPWVPWEPAFDGWIIDHDITVLQAHNMWVDVFFQLGAVGFVVLVLAYLAFIWRSWFFAVDRPRWDLQADRPYTAVTLLPSLLGAVLLVQGFSESGPLMLWGWGFLVMFAFKIKSVPFVGIGPAEQTLALERGELPKRAP